MATENKNIICVFTRTLTASVALGNKWVQPRTSHPTHRPYTTLRRNL